MSAPAILEREAYRPPRGHLLSPKEQERVWSKVVIPDIDPETSCWRWTGSFNTSGDGIISLRAKVCTAARILWEDTGHETVPPRKRLMRSCPNTWCVNPAHRHRQGPAGRDVFTADITLRGKPTSEVIPADVATLPLRPEFAVPAEPERDLEAEHDAREAAEVEPTSVPRAARGLMDTPRMDFLSRSVTTVVVMPNATIVYTPDASTCGYGSDLREAVDNAREKVERRRAQQRAGAA